MRTVVTSASGAIVSELTGFAIGRALGVVGVAATLAAGAPLVATIAVGTLVVVLRT